MKNLLKLEEIGQLVVAIVLFNQLDYAWWLFPACLLLPDLAMLGYVLNAKFGAWLYNVSHHKLLAVLIGLAGFYLGNDLITFIGIILFAHAAMDRIFGYGLKYADHFKHTHLGWIGAKDQN